MSPPSSTVPRSILAVLAATALSTATLAATPTPASAQSAPVSARELRFMAQQLGIGG